MSTNPETVTESDIAETDISENVQPTDRTVVMLNERTRMTCTALYEDDTSGPAGLVLEIEEFDQPPLDESGERNLAASYWGRGYQRWDLPAEDYYTMMNDLAGMFLFGVSRHQ